LLKTNGFRVKKSGYTFGNFGALSWEFGKKFLGSQGSIKGLVFLAVSSILAHLDTVVENKHGNGIFVLAVKPE
jgi:hypothetical protein